MEKVFNVKLKEKFLELQLKINEDEGVMREESREQKFNDMETLLEGLFEDVKSKYLCPFNEVEPR